jgi:hypothetical protein
MFARIGKRGAQSEATNLFAAETIPRRKSISEARILLAAALPCTMSLLGTPKAEDGGYSG